VRPARGFFFACRGPLEVIASFPRFGGSVADEALPLAFVRPTFDEVYAETFPAVWRMASRSGIVESALDDVLQDVYLTVFRKLEHFEGRSAVKTWVLAITIRVVSNHIRMRRRKGAAHALTSVVDDPESVPDAAPDPHERLAREEAMRTVRDLIAGMDQRRAAIFMLVELGGLSVAEVARELGGNVNTLQARLCAARRDFERGLQRRQGQKR
jgi:RNA polymerase sigma-70 factor (ECF subfamily)